ncbi:collagen binding domain-containing protein [Micromonospora chersina]|uniref:MSCRAMM family protein n=1 Tax=Micromonospora chersina TaxID=47854 RepID=UPI003718DE1E
MRPIVRRLGAVTLTVLLTALAAFPATPASAAAASITGHVLDAQTGGAPANGACVYAWEANGGGIVAGTCVDLQTGAFTLDGLESGVGYRIEVSPGGDLYPAQTWLPGAATSSDAVPVVAPAVLDVALPRAGTLTGTLTRSDGTPAAGLNVLVWLANREEAFGRSTTTAEDGSWTIGGLYPTSYKVSFDCCWPAWAYGATDWAGAAVVDVDAGVTVRVDDTYWLPATLSGRITDAATGQPIEGACIELRNVDPAGGGGYSGGCTDATGTYLAEYVVPGQFRVIFYDPQGRYAVAYHGGDDLASATVVTIPRGGRVTGVDGGMSLGATITGRVVDSRTRQPVQWVCPLAFAGRDGDYVPYEQQECSDADGRWRLSALPARPTTVRLDGGDRYGVVWLYRAETQAGATVFQPRPGETITAREVRLVAR